MDAKKVDIKDFGLPKGLGVLAAEPIKKGEYVVSYLGDVIPESEATKREEEYDKRGMTHYYLLVTDCRRNNPATGRIERLVIDPTEPRPEFGWARLINCSKRHANLKPRSFRRKASPFIEVKFEAKRDIAVGEELLWDYDPSRRDF